MPRTVRTATILISDLVGSTGLESRVGPTRADEQLHVRIGVAAGEATVEDGDYFGMPSIEAARLCDAAPGGSILTTALVRMLAARSDPGRFEPAAMLELKGIPEPVEAARVAARGRHRPADARPRRRARVAARRGPTGTRSLWRLLRNMRESGAAVQDEQGRWVLLDEGSQPGLPESVREVIGRRAQRLGEETRRTLAAAAVIGRDFELELLAEIVQEDEDVVLDRLDSGLEASLIGERAGRPGWFTFTHALVEHTLYEELGAARRARLHRRIAEALERQLGDDPGERVGELARHWSEAVKPIETTKAADYATQAGCRALEQVAPDEAQRWFEQALELLHGHEGELRREVLVLLGDARRQTGDSRYRDTLLEAAAVAVAAGDPGREAARARSARSSATSAASRSHSDATTRRRLTSLWRPPSTSAWAHRSGKRIRITCWVSPSCGGPAPTASAPRRC